MTKISVYQIDEYVTADDKWIGTDVNTYNKTKNFTPRKLAVYFNGNQVINTGVDLLYKYFTITPPEDRPIGTLSFETEIGPTVNFSAISTFLLSKTTQKGNDVSEFLNFLVNSTSLIYKAKNINLFGSYKIVSVEPYFLDPNFFVVNVDFIEGNGFMEEDEDYMISIVDLDRTIEVPQLVKETFDYTSSNSFVVANEINNILQVIVNTTSLHPEAYSYTLPSTITIINELEAGDVITVVYNYIEEFLDVPDLQRVTNVGNHTTNSIVIDNTPGEWGDYTTINTINDLGAFQSFTSPTNIDYQSEYSGYGMYINEIYSATDSREMYIESGTIQTSYTDVDDYNEIKMYSGSSTEGPVLSMERNYVTCQLKINDMTESIILQIPNKPEGTYTIATTEDIPSPLPSFLEFNATDKTVWNNGQGDVAANTSFGASALKTNTTGTDNSAFGVSALRKNTSGSYNTAIGPALSENTIGSNNISVGYVSQSSATIASSNVSIGNASLYWNIDGNGNTAIGHDSGVYETSNPLTKINNSVFIGKNTRAFAVNDTNEIVIGADTTGSGSNTATLGNDSITSTILKGLVKAPLTTNALIDADTTGKAVVTKEYVDNRLVLEKSGNYTLVDADSGGIIIFTVSATLTIPTGLSDGFECTFVTLAGVTLTVSATGVTLNNNTSTTLLPQLSFTLKRRIATDQYIATGNL